MWRRYTAGSLIDPACATLIDLRPAAQRTALSLPGSRPVLNLTLEAIEEGSTQLSKQESYLVICERGPRSALAARYLRADGINAEAWRGTLEELQQILAQVT